ncbi:hypothetical protein [Methanimicrococcus hongohii]|uniref:hypothetical protein n=1 Tax=Methanimicrococcus hongohii TaxID=3028295 RepID=UPI00292F5F91|nr:hypothetical protein [Methanimicrococcus sp. Hf6]
MRAAAKTVPSKCFHATVFSWCCCRMVWVCSGREVFVKIASRFFRLRRHLPLPRASRTVFQKTKTKTKTNRILSNQEIMSTIHNNLSELFIFDMNSNDIPIFFKNVIKNTDFYV